MCNCRNCEKSGFEAIGFGAIIFIVVWAGYELLKFIFQI
jgi:hypothetical protein